MKCIKCNTRIATHLWLVRGDAFCSPGCQRGGKSQFEKLYKALAAMKRSSVDTS